MAREQWESGRSVWDADLGGRDLVVDQVEAREGAAPGSAARVLDMGEGESAWIRSRRFVLDGKPVLLSTSYLPASLVAGSAITRQDTGPGGTYARWLNWAISRSTSGRRSGRACLCRRRRRG